MTPKLPASALALLFSLDREARLPLRDDLGAQRDDARAEMPGIVRDRALARAEAKRARRRARNRAVRA